MISSLRGRCPKPLDECATYNSEVKSSQKFTTELLEKFITSRPQGTSIRSIESYHYTLDGFVGYPITAQGITAYLNGLTCGNGIAKFYSCLRALCNWLHQNDYISRNPIKQVSPPRIQKKVLPAVSEKQFKALLNHCHCERDKALISLLWYSGMRISEAINVKASDFDWKEGTVIVLGKGRRYRKCLAGDGLVKRWFSTHNTFEITKGGAQTILKRLKVESGIACNAHSFRRGFACNLHRDGMDIEHIMRLGGWESLEMVLRYTQSVKFEDSLKHYYRLNKRY